MLGNKLSPNLSVLKYHMCLLIISIVQNMSHEHGEIMISPPEGLCIFAYNNKIYHSDGPLDKILNVCVLIFKLRFFGIIIYF